MRRRPEATNAIRRLVANPQGGGGGGGVEESNNLTFKSQKITNTTKFPSCLTMAHIRMLIWLPLLVVAMIPFSQTGITGMDLPDGIESVLGFRPKSSFRCERDGYFGDVENDCRLFHLCQKQSHPQTGRVEWRHWTYACGNQTMFNQLTLTCAFVDEAIPCKHASQFQYLNEVIHKPREPFLTDADVTSGFSYYSNRIMSDGARARAFQDTQLLAQLGGTSTGGTTGGSAQPVEQPDVSQVNSREAANQLAKLERLQEIQNSQNNQLQNHVQNQQHSRQQSQQIVSQFQPESNFNFFPNQNNQLPVVSAEQPLTLPLNEVPLNASPEGQSNNLADRPLPVEGFSFALTTNHQPGSVGTFQSFVPSRQVLSQLSNANQFVTIPTTTITSNSDISSSQPVVPSTFASVESQPATSQVLTAPTQTTLPTPTRSLNQIHNQNQNQKRKSIRKAKKIKVVKQTGSQAKARRQQASQNGQLRHQQQQQFQQQQQRIQSAFPRVSFQSNRLPVNNGPRLGGQLDLGQESAIVMRRHLVPTATSGSNTAPTTPLTSTSTTTTSLGVSSVRSVSPATTINTGSGIDSQTATTTTTTTTTETSSAPTTHSLGGSQSVLSLSSGPKVSGESRYQSIGWPKNFEAVQLIAGSPRFESVVTRRRV